MSRKSRRSQAPIDGDAVVTAAQTVVADAPAVSRAVSRGMAFLDLAATGTGVQGDADETAASGATESRMRVFVAPDDIMVIDDAFEAGPTSMREAIATLMATRSRGAHVAVLGDMAQLGSLSELAHFRVGEAVAQSGVEHLVTVGGLARRIAEGALAEGMPPESVRPCETLEEASEVLDDLLEPGDVALVKASRSMDLGRIVEGILAKDA
jgi:UDP-N-acetylmuramoyl-tripeptide--D-alanyl-D-alanine ligase